MAAWSEFETKAPAIAEAGRALIYQFGKMGLGFLATVRKDGAPRLHPICLTIVDGGLYAFILSKSPKCADLRRDGRYALHAFPPAQVDDELMLAGRAYAITADPGRIKRVREDLLARGMIDGGDPETLFEFSIDRAMHAKYQKRPSWPPKYSIWKA